jgi:hypothetical protein
VSGEAKTIVISHSIAAPPEAVWVAIQNQTSLASEVDDVREVKVFAADQIPSLGKTERIVSWWVWLKGFELKWQEYQKLDGEAWRLEFQQIEGIFSTYHGFWQVVSDGNKAVAELHLCVGTGMPHLSEFLDPVIANAVEALACKILHGVERLSLVRTQGVFKG